MSSPQPGFPEDLVRRRPLPLAQLYRRAHNSRTPQERHLAAFYLWEVALRLLSSVALVEYAALGEHDEAIDQRLTKLGGRGDLGLWWQVARLLVPLLADRGDPYFGWVRGVLFGGRPADLAALTALQAAVDEHKPEGRDRAIPTLSLERLITALIVYRNRELGQGVDWRRSAEEYARLGNRLLGAAAEVFARLDVLAGRRLVFLTNRRASAEAAPVLDRFELTGEVPVRLQPVTLAAGAPGTRRAPNGSTC
jgi:hypothetical protein